MPVSLAAIVVLTGLVLLPMNSDAQSCQPPTISSETSVEAIRAYFQKRNMTVVTFMGYSAADYEDRAAMLKRAEEVLSGFDPGKTIVNIGATIDGIGAVYELAKQKGFETVGIVSSQARVSNATLAPCAGTVFFVEDASWGGMLTGTTTLSPTSTTLVSVSDRIVAIGGGDVARDEFNAARRLGKKTEFFPADMNHEIARARAARNKQPAPTDFRGALGAALAGAAK
jgi:hypothetical protein